MPAHARVNNRCYTKWADLRDDLDIVWEGRTYANPFAASQRFFTVVRDRPCNVSTCVQRLFCTDSGAVGWYGKEGRQDVPLRATWLRNTSATFETTLKDSGVRWTSGYGPGTLTVVGNTVFFHAFMLSDGYTKQWDLPWLFSLNFKPYQEGAAGKDLVEWGLRNFRPIDVRQTF